MELPFGPVDAFLCGLRGPQRRGMVCSWEAGPALLWVSSLEKGQLRAFLKPFLKPLQLLVLSAGQAETSLHEPLGYDSLPFKCLCGIWHTVGAR